MVLSANGLESAEGRKMAVPTRITNHPQGIASPHLIDLMFISTLVDRENDLIMQSFFAALEATVLADNCCHLAEQPVISSLDASELSILGGVDPSFRRTLN